MGGALLLVITAQPVRDRGGDGGFCRSAEGIGHGMEGGWKTWAVQTAAGEQPPLMISLLPEGTDDLAMGLEVLLKFLGITGLCIGSASLDICGRAGGRGGAACACAAGCAGGGWSSGCTGCEGVRAEDSDSCSMVMACSAITTPAADSEQSPTVDPGGVNSGLSGSECCGSLLTEALLGEKLPVSEPRCEPRFLFPQQGVEKEAWELGGGDRRDLSAALTSSCVLMRPRLGLSIGSGARCSLAGEEPLSERAPLESLVSREGVVREEGVGGRRDGPGPALAASPLRAGVEFDCRAAGLTCLSVLPLVALGLSSVPGWHSSATEAGAEAGGDGARDDDFVGAADCEGSTARTSVVSAVPLAALPRGESGGFPGTALSRGEGGSPPGLAFCTACPWHS